MKNKAVLILFLLFCFFPYIQPAKYCLNDTLVTIFDLWLKITWIIAIFLTLKRKKISLYCILFIIFQFCFVFSTYLNKNYGDLQNSIYLFVNNCSLFLLGEYFIKKDVNIFLKYLSILFGIFIIINIITMFIYYPNGMYTDILGDPNYYFLEHDNGSFYYALPTILLFVLYNIRKYNKINFLCYGFIIINIIGYLYVWSTMAFSCLIFLLIVLLLFNNKIVKKIISSNIPEIIILSLLIGIVFFNIQNKFQDLLSNIFKKDVTLSGRTKLWEKSIEVINNNKLIGYGQEYLDIRMKRFGISHVHNIVLQILYNGGIVAMSFFSVLILKIRNNFKKYSSEKISQLLKIFVFIYFFSSIFDFYNTKFIVYIIFICCCNIDIIARRDKENE